MVMNPRTAYLNLPLPHEKNDMREDLPRLIAQANGFDAHARTTDEALAARLAQAEAADEAIQALHAALADDAEKLAALDAELKIPPTAEQPGRVRAGRGLQVRAGTDGQSNVLEVKPGSGLGLDAENQLEVKPDPATLAISPQGQLTALGGNLAYNEEVWILASGTFTAPVTGWYDVLTFDGGGNGAVPYGPSGKTIRLESLGFGAKHSGIVHLNQGEEVEVVVGAGAPSGGMSQQGKNGGITSFGNKPLTFIWGGGCDVRTYPVNIGYEVYHVSGSGPGGGYPSQSGATQAEKNKNCSASGYWGGSGAVRYTNASDYGVGAGAQGSVRLRYWNPDKANG